MLVRGSIPPLLPSISDQLEISGSQAGIALTVMWAVYALLHFPAGRVSDQLSRRTILTGSLVMTVLGVAFLIVVNSFWSFVAAVSLVGVGAGLYFAPSRALLSDVFVERHGTALGVQAAAGTLGSAAAGGLALAALAVGPWQYAFPPILVLLVAVVILLQRSVEEQLVVDHVRLEFVQTGQRIFGSREIRIILLVYIIFTFI